MTDLRLIYGNAAHRPLIEAVGKMGGIVRREAGIADVSERIDPLELVRQRAQRDFALDLIERLGWTLDLQPPAAPAKALQQFAETE